MKALSHETPDLHQPDLSIEPATVLLVEDDLHLRVAIRISHARRGPGAGRRLHGRCSFSRWREQLMPGFGLLRSFNHVATSMAGSPAVYRALTERTVWFLGSVPIVGLHADAARSVAAVAPCSI